MMETIDRVGDARAAGQGRHTPRTGKRTANDVVVPAFNVLSLCAGVGGLDLGLRLAVPAARTVCYVERNEFAAAVLAARAEDGALDDAPIWDDVGTFDGRPWRGVVDCVAAGFPCQPVSLAGQRKGMADERFIWGDIERIIAEVEPRFVFLENVPGILSADAGWFLDRVLSGLVVLGFDCEWDLFSAAETGAPHRRQRWFLLGLADAERAERGTGAAGGNQSDGDHAGRGEAPGGTRERGAVVANAGRRRDDTGQPLALAWRGDPTRARQAGAGLADPAIGGRGAAERDDGAGQPDAAGRGAELAHADGRDDDRRRDGGTRRRRERADGGESLADAPRDLRRARGDDGREPPDGSGDRVGHAADDGRGPAERDDGLGDAEGGRVRRGATARTVERGDRGLADAALFPEREPADEALALAVGGQARAFAGGGSRVYPPARDDAAGWVELIGRDPSLEPAVRRDADGLAAGVDRPLYAFRADRLRAVGNGVVPLTSALAFTVLLDRLTEGT